MANRVRADRDVVTGEHPSHAWADPSYQAFLILRTGFVVAPILFGIDKFFNWMTDWPKYLWTGFPDLFNVSAQNFMYAVGVIEIIGGLLVLLFPRFGPYVIAAWLAGIITNLVIYSIAEGGHTDVYWDIALRDFGLMLGALALARLAVVHARGHHASLTSSLGSDRRYDLDERRPDAMRRRSA